MTWAKSRTDKPNDGVFEDYLDSNGLVRRTPYTAVKRISRTTGKGKGQIKSASWMDSHFDNKNQTYIDSVGNSLNAGANELADVLHTFFLNVVEEDE